MKLLQELTGMNQQRKYRITFEAEAAAYNAPSYFNIPDEEDDTITFTGPQCKEFQDRCLEMWTKNEPRKPDMANLGIEVLNVEIEEVTFYVGGLIERAADHVEYMADYEEEEDEDENPRDTVMNYGDAMGISGTIEFPYEVKFVVTVAKPLSQDAIDWLVEDTGGGIWSQYWESGNGASDTTVEEIK